MQYLVTLPGTKRRVELLELCWYFFPCLTAGVVRAGAPVLVHLRPLPCLGSSIVEEDNKWLSMPQDVASLSNSLTQLLAAAVGCAHVERRPAMADSSSSNCAESCCILEMPRTLTCVFASGYALMLEVLFRRASSRGAL